MIEFVSACGCSWIAVRTANRGRVTLREVSRNIRSCSEAVGTPGTIHPNWNHSGLASDRQAVRLLLALAARLLRLLLLALLERGRALAGRPGAGFVTGGITTGAAPRVYAIELGNAPLEQSEVPWPVVSSSSSVVTEIDAAPAALGGTHSAITPRTTANHAARRRLISDSPSPRLGYGGRQANGESGDAAGQPISFRPAGPHEGTSLAWDPDFDHEPIHPTAPSPRLPGSGRRDPVPAPHGGPDRAAGGTSPRLARSPRARSSSSRESEMRRSSSSFRERSTSSTANPRATSTSPSARRGRSSATSRCSPASRRSPAASSPRIRRCWC